MVPHFRGTRSFEATVSRVEELVILLPTQNLKAYKAYCELYQNVGPEGIPKFIIVPKHVLPPEDRSSISPGAKVVVTLERSCGDGEGFLAVKACSILGIRSPS